MTTTECSSEQRRRLLERLRNGEIRPKQEVDQPIGPATTEQVPLSSGQQQVWFQSELAAQAPIYNESITIRKTGGLDRIVVESCLNEIVRRHDVLRTCFCEANDRITQIVQQEMQIPLPMLDLSHLPIAEAEAEALQMAREDGRQPFDLRQPSLLRARLIRLREDEHRLYLTFHHLIFDAASIYRVFVPELAQLYRAFFLSAASPLPELPIRYGDYACWQQAKLRAGDYVTQLDYWRETLTEGIPALQLPSKSRPAVPTWQADMETFSMPAQFSRAVKEFSAREGSTVYMTLLASFHVLLHRYSAQECITTGAVVSKRDRPELQALIGLLLNTVLVQSHLNPATSFRECSLQIRNKILSALANSDVPFDAVVRHLAPKRETTRNTLFQVLFSLRPSVHEFPDGWALGELDVHSGASGFDLFVDVIEGPEHITGRVIYSGDLFERYVVARMIGHWLTTLEAMLANPELPIGLAPLLTSDEREQILRAGRGVRVEAEATTIHGLFEKTAQQNPERLAIVFEDERLTFWEVDERASQFAAQLRALGVRPGALIAVSVERSVQMVIGLLGILKAGAAYLPIDPSLPADRREFLVSDAKPHFCVTSRALTITDYGRENLGRHAGSAYVLYTSGSTGVPKGVEVPVSAVVNLLEAMQKRPGFSCSDILLAITTLSFDIAALELFLPLISGGRLVIAPRATVSDPARLVDAIRESGCTVMQGTPAVWRSILDAGWTGNPNLKILCGGEALQRSLADRLLPRCAELWNLYGPTETTIWSTAHKVQPSAEPPSIGQPIDNTQIYILDGQLQLVPAGVIGELYIGGTGVARGYLGRPELTAERFLVSPLCEGERIYRTGDLARWGSSGELEFLGRADNQVKVRGHRIELGEIEEALAKVPGVRAAAVKPWRDASGENALVAYVQGTTNTAVLREHLARKMPEYMIPSRFIEVQALPLNANGKVDRKALPEPRAEELSPLGRTAPRTRTEQRLSQIWAALLNLHEPDVHADFFELGGHSLLAAELCRRVQSEFGAPFSLSTLFESTTIAALATRLDADVRRGQTARQIESEQQAEEKCLHWVNPGRFLRPLASHLGGAAHLQSVTLPQDLERTIRSMSKLEDVARLMVAEVRANSPGGPYRLGGWCVSGILAYEVAVQLQALGEEVELVVLLGAANPKHYTAIPRSTRLRSKLRFHWSHMRRVGMTGVSGYLRSLAPYHLTKHNPVRAGDFSRILSDLALRYEPKPLSARVVLFQGEDRPSIADHAVGWTDVVTGDFASHDVPGDHTTSLLEPNVAILAEKLRACLR